MLRKSASNVAGAAIVLVFFSFLSKGLGFVREIVFANKFGLSDSFDIFLVGSVFPTIIVSVLIYLGQNYFIPNYAKLKSDFEKNEFLKAVLFFFFFSSLLIIVLLLIFSTYIVESYLGITNHQGFSTAVNIFRLYLFSIPIWSLISVLSAYLQAEYDFSTPSISLVISSLILIITVLFFTNYLGIFAIPVGFLVGTFLQLVFLIIVIRKRIKISLTFEAGIFKKLSIGKNLFIILLIEILGQIFVVADRQYYNKIDSGSFAALNYASNIYQLPITIFSLAFAMALFPKLSDDFHNSSIQKFNETISKSLSVSFYFFLPVMMIFLLSSEFIVRIIYQHGNFTSSGTALTSDLLRIYSYSLAFYAGYSIFYKAYFSKGIAHILLIVGIVVVVTKFVLNAILVMQLKQYGLAVSSSVCYTLLFLISFLIIFKDSNKKILVNVFNNFFISALLVFSAYIIVKISTPIFYNFFRFELFSLSVFVVSFIALSWSIKFEPFILLNKSIIQYLDHNKE